MQRPLIAVLFRPAKSKNCFRSHGLEGIKIVMVSHYKGAMIKSISSFLTLLSICFLSVSCAKAADLESANELYAKSGLEKQMRDIGPALLAGYRNNYSKSKRHTARDKKIYRNIGQMIEHSFDTQAIKEIVVNGLVKNIAESDMKLILAWLDSPAGNKITKMEERASSREGMEELENYMRNIQKYPLSAKKIRLIKDLNSSMNITETTVDLTLVAQFALSMTTKKPKRKMSRDDIRKLYAEFIKKNRSRIEPMIAHQVQGSLLYTYRTLPNGDLEKYVTFSKTASGKKYNNITTSYILKAITMSSLKFALATSRL